MEVCYTLDKTKDNYDILRVNKQDKKMYLGSKYRENEEINKIIKEQGVITENTNYIVFGIGTGNVVRELIKRKSSNSKIIIIEIDRELLNFIKNSGVINDLIERDDIIIVYEKRDIVECINLNINYLNVKFLKIIETTNYSKVYGSELQEYYSEIKDVISNICINRNTVKLFSVKWYNTLLENLKFYINGASILDYKDKYKDKPAIIVSAGPSLNKNIDLLKYNNNNIVITGGRPLKALCERNIHMDFLEIIDSLPRTFEVVEQWLDQVECPLVMNETTNSNVTLRHKGEKIVATRHRFIRKAFNYNIGTIDYGGSVAHSMVYFAIVMGCNPIIFIGQDLAYTDNKAHADGIANGENTIKENKKGQDIYVEDINGKNVKTSLVLNNFRLQMEDMVESNPETRFINATEGGAHIKGTEVMTLKEALEKFCKEEFDKKVIKKCDNEGKKEILVAELRSILKEMNRCRDLADKSLNIFRKYKAAYFANKEDKMRILNIKLNTLEEELKESYRNTEILENLVFDFIYQISNTDECLVNENDSKSDILNKKFLKNEAIYIGTIELMDMVIPKLEETIDNMC
ncbi:6-hydroxymethylpterin diphosphokinase MptE-like protein [uncultured Clostridium sp.]|uniref:motility associated factor glycosyltransferase family protein n=1 Tax=uncultured Clostridium sp. TaxID=59620 RepID=UPI0032166810